MQPAPYHCNMALNIILFGQLADLAGSSAIELDAADVAGIQQEIQKRYPALQGLSYRVAIDKKIVEGNPEVPAGSQVALLPPFSGG
jgi:sulfur-carrier protein